MTEDRALTDMGDQAKKNAAAIRKRGTTNRGGVPIEEIMDLLDMPSRQVDLLTRQGVMVRVSGGRFDLRASVRRFSRYIREVAGGRAQGLDVGGINVVEESAKLKMAQREHEQLKIDEMRGNLISRKCYDRTILGAFRFFGTTVNALPSRLITGLHLSSDQSRKCEEIVRKALKDVVATKPETIIVDDEAYEAALSKKKEKAAISDRPRRPRLA